MTGILSSDEVYNFEYAFILLSFHRNLAPRYYSNVRIHVGKLPKGILTEKFEVKRTTYLDYTGFQKDDKTSVERSVRQWKSTDGLRPSTKADAFFTFDDIFAGQKSWIRTVLKKKKKDMWDLLYLLQRLTWLYACQTTIILE